MSSIENIRLSTKEPFANLPDVVARQTMAEIGRRLGALREAMGLSQVTISQRLGLGPIPGGPQKWNNWEHGRNQIPPDHATALCIMSGVDLDYIYRGNMDRVPPELQPGIYAVLGEPKKAAKRPRKA